MRLPRTAILIVLSLLPAGCYHPAPTPCAGLVYKESGLERNEYLPCATAMIDELDRFHLALQAMGNERLAMSARRQARQRCLASNVRLSRLIREAGGSTKLVSVAWDDVALNRMNYEILAARDEYLMYCYYGPGVDVFDLDSVGQAHAAARRALAELR